MTPLCPVCNNRGILHSKGGSIPCPNWCPARSALDITMNEDGIIVYMGPKWGSSGSLLYPDHPAYYSPYCMDAWERFKAWREEQVYDWKYEADKSPPVPMVLRVTRSMLFKAIHVMRSNEGLAPLPPGPMSITIDNPDGTSTLILGNSDVIAIRFNEEGKPK